jgi:hypothetical protein
MSGWAWLTQPRVAYRWGFVARVLLKALVLFVLVNLAFALLDPLPALGRVSVYNTLVPGRERLPYGEDPEQSYSLSLNSIDAMFASHQLARPKAGDEYRVLVMGDSSVWGFLLRPDDTLTAYLNAAGLRANDGRVMRFYNLGYPIMALMKDTLLLDEAMRYQPDAVVWLVTLESFARDKQLFPPLVQENGTRVRRLIDTYGLDYETSELRALTPLEGTLLGRRREVADWLRLQLYGFAWATTGIDQHYPEQYDLRTSDFGEDVSWQTFDAPTTLNESDLAFDVLRAGMARVGDMPILIVNEPMFISSGRNSDLRYNFFYPRWVYDQYRALLAEAAEAEVWAYADLWDVIPPDEFTDSPVHLTPAGSRQLASHLIPALETLDE